MNVDDVSSVRPPEDIYKPDTNNNADKTTDEEKKVTESQDNEAQNDQIQNDNNNDQYTQYNVNLLA